MAKKNGPIKVKSAWLYFYGGFGGCVSHSFYKLFGCYRIGKFIHLQNLTFCIFFLHRVIEKVFINGLQFLSLYPKVVGSYNRFINYCLDVGRSG
jgi:hypothetical protein